MRQGGSNKPKQAPDEKDLRASGWISGEEKARLNEQAAKDAARDAEEKMERLAKEAREPMNRIWRDLRKNLLDNARELGASIVKGDIGKAIQSAFDTLSSALSDAVSTSISKSMGGGFGGDLLGAFGGGLVGAGISLLGGLFSHKEKGAGEDEYNPVYASITNWEDFKLGFTLPASWIFSGRAGYHSEIGPSGWELDATRQTRRLGLHYAT
jgi:DNA primase catalytic subunit